MLNVWNTIHYYMTLQLTKNTICCTIYTLSIHNIYIVDDVCLLLQYQQDEYMFIWLTYINMIITLMFWMLKHISCDHKIFKWYTCIYVINTYNNNGDSTIYYLHISMLYDKCSLDSQECLYHHKFGINFWMV